MLLRNDLMVTFTVTPKDGSERDAEVAVEFSAGEILSRGEAVVTLLRPWRQDSRGAGRML